MAKIGFMNGETKSVEELCRVFVEKGKQDPNWIVNNTVAFLIEYKDRYDRREISGSTIRNYVKVVKLLCEMNDIAIAWKKITRGLPKGCSGIGMNEYPDSLNLNFEDFSLESLCLYIAETFLATIYI